MSDPNEEWGRIKESGPVLAVITEQDRPPNPIGIKPKKLVVDRVRELAEKMRRNDQLPDPDDLDPRDVSSPGHSATTVSEWAGIQNTLLSRFVPEDLAEFMGGGRSDFGLESDDTIAISSRNFDNRVEEGELYLVRWHPQASRGEPVTWPVVAIGKAVEVPPNRQGDMVVNIGGEEVGIKGWNVSSVVKPEAYNKLL